MKRLLSLTLAALLAAPAASVAAPHSRRHITAAAAPTRTSAPAGADPRTRTLDDIHIEGEIPVPQVLFVTARDQRRFVEFQHHRYLRTSAQLGEATALPRWIVVATPPPPAGKETPR